ncbi:MULTISPECIES: hypothetical protein [unclassified Streptomyces]|uniref:hypothetical protein n=1 Tax=unclassified Streptomyces TaxID=2593676 RepID=UPI00037109E3|nr:MULTISPECIES: hypothetical protein [unclassified Streptomyces]MYY02378.1 hypothetical protein [Streptomyces sp. SID4913]
MAENVRRHSWEGDTRAFGVAEVVVGGLIVFCVVAAVLHSDSKKAGRALKILPMLLGFATSIRE